MTKQWRNIKEVPVTHISFPFPWFLSPHLARMPLKANPPILLVNLYVSSFSPMFWFLFFSIYLLLTTVWHGMFRFHIFGSLHTDCRSIRHILLTYTLSAFIYFIKLSNQVLTSLETYICVLYIQHITEADTTEYGYF